MSLDDHGKLGAAVIPFYLPFLVLSFILSWRHGFGRNTGWVYLLVFSISESQIATRILWFVERISS